MNLEPLTVNCLGKKSDVLGEASLGSVNSARSEKSCLKVAGLLLLVLRVRVLANACRELILYL